MSCTNYKGLAPFFSMWRDGEPRRHSGWVTRDVGATSRHRAACTVHAFHRNAQRRNRLMNTTSPAMHMSSNNMARGFTLLLGVWLFISAFIWQHTEAQMTNTWICGVITVIFA